MHVSAVLAGRPPAVVSPRATVKDLVSHLARHDVGAAVVSSDGVTVDGLVSERDVIRALRDRGAAALDASVATVMNAAAPSVRPSDRYLDAL